MRAESTVESPMAIISALETADDLGIDLSFCAQRVDGSGTVLSHRADALWPGASLYKLPAGIALHRAKQDRLSEPVLVLPQHRVDGGAGLSLMEDPVTVTWRELVRFMLVGSDNTAAAIILDEIGIPAVDAVALDAGMRDSTIASAAETVRQSVDTARRRSSFTTGRDLDDDLLDFTRTDQVLGSLTTAADQVRLLSSLWSGALMDSRGTDMICSMLAQQIAPTRISRTLSYPGVRVAAKTGTWGPFRHDSAVVSHERETPVAVSVLTRSLEFDRLIPAIDDGIGGIAASLVDGIRSESSHGGWQSE